MKPSNVPAVVDQLLVLASQVTPDGFSVLDGPVRDFDTFPRYLLIGWSGQPDTRGIEAEVMRQGANQHTEVIDVHGAVQASFGDDGQKKARDAVYAVLDAFAAAIDGRDGGLRTLRGVTRADLSKHGVEPYIGNGAGCVVTFTIHIEGTR